MILEVIPEWRHDIDPQLEHARVFVLRGAEPRGALLGLNVSREQVDPMTSAIFRR